MTKYHVEDDGFMSYYICDEYDNDYAECYTLETAQLICRLLNEHEEMYGDD